MVIVYIRPYDRCAALGSATVQGSG
jgi:hypothetical protein